MLHFIGALWFCWVAALAPAQTTGQIMATGNGPPTLETLAPGQVTTLFVVGLKVPNATASGIPLPTTLSGLTVHVSGPVQAKGYPERLPLFSVRTYDGCFGLGPCPLTFVTVQIPTEPTCVPTTGWPNECTMGSLPIVGLTVEHSGGRGPTTSIVVSGSKPHFLNSCDTVFGSYGGFCQQFVTHPSGQPVTGSNPARAGETIVMYAIGLGPTQLAVKSGEAATEDAPVQIPPPLLLSYKAAPPPSPPAPPGAIWIPTGWIIPIYAGLVKGAVGLYQINVKLPDEFPPEATICQPSNSSLDGNFRLSIGMGYFGETARADHIAFCMSP
ncbi:MAG: hypothetical protein JST93_30365 [Acidobacteria bacterium]|nr:hypothetical protein [Acidobacteriota bacterium]